MKKDGIKKLFTLAFAAICKLYNLKAIYCFNPRFHRGQPVYVEGKDIVRYPAHISAIGTEVVNIQKLYLKAITITFS